MQDDPIRKALEKAEDALAHAIHWRCSDRAAARRTIVAFLRALPSGGWSFDGCHITAPHMAAAAVERAAHE